MRGIPIEFELEKAVNFAKREITAYMSTPDVDRQGHRVLSTAFRNSEARIRKGEVPLFRDHRTNIGVVLSGAADSRGYLTVSYVSKDPEGDKTLEKASDKSIRGYSFTGTPLPNRWEVNLEKGDDGVDRAVTTFHEIKLRECGPCMDLFPVNERAEILAVKGFSEVDAEWLYDLPHIIKSLVLGRKTVTGEDERIAKAALRAYEALHEDADLLKALLAPESGTSSPRTTPPESTPAEAEKKQSDLSVLMGLARQLGQVAA